MEHVNRARLGYSDFLRCLATLAVVTLHCAGATLAAEAPTSARFFVLNLLDGCGRWAVPMFVMLSGMFLLDPEKPMPAKKWLGHVGRLALAILLWGGGYALWDARAAHLGLEWLLEGLISLVAGRLHYHLWFLPMLLGLYLLIPPLRALVRGASRKTLWYLTGLWGAVTVCLNTLYGFFPGGPGQSWLNMLGLYNLAGYAGYFLLGYLLKTCEIRPWAERSLYVLGLLGLVVTCAGTRVLSQRAGVFQDRLYGNLTPNVCLTAAALFLLCRRLELGRGTIWGRLAPLTFGVYLLHPLFIELFNILGFPDPMWNVAWAVPLQVLTVTLPALALTWLLRHIPKLGKYLC